MALRTWVGGSGRRRPPFLREGGNDPPPPATSVSVWSIGVLLLLLLPVLCLTALCFVLPCLPVLLLYRFVCCLGTWVSGLVLAFAFSQGRFASADVLANLFFKNVLKSFLTKQGRGPVVIFPRGSPWWAVPWGSGGYQGGGAWATSLGSWFLNVGVPRCGGRGSIGVRSSLACRGFTACALEVELVVGWWA